MGWVTFINKIYILFVFKLMNNLSLELNPVNYVLLVIVKNNTRIFRHQKMFYDHIAVKLLNVIISKQSVFLT